MINEFNFSNQVVRTDLKRLINQIWKLLPMRENQEDWQKQLRSVLVELRGLQQLFDDKLNFLIIISKLLGLQTEEDFMTYRLAVFSVISLLTEINKSLDE